MMLIVKKRTGSTRKIATFSHSRGFSLIVTVTMLILLSLIAIGLLSLSSTVLRSSQSDKDMLEARSNARLGLQLAIGELQRTMGPDTRVSANGAILEHDKSVANGMRHIAGAWNAWQADPNNVGNYESHKRGLPAQGEIDKIAQPGGGFYRWLVSAENDLDAREVDYATREPQGEQVTLVPVVGQDSNSLVKATRVRLTADNGESKGQFAWAIMDEGQKAAANGIAPSESSFQPLETLATQSEIAWGNVDEWAVLENLSEEGRRKLISLDTMTLGGIPDALEFSHDLTPYSASVLTDTARGGLRTDLSQLLGQEELPAEYSSRHLYSDSNSPLIEAPDRGDHKYLWPSLDPQWHILHKFHRIPEDVFLNNSESPRLRFEVTSRSSARSSMPHRPNGYTGMRGDLTGPDSYHNSLKLAPVISKAQFIFSLTFARGSFLKNAWNKDGGQRQSNWDSQALMIIDPVVTLWNPYDVPIDVSSFRIYLYRIPISFKFDTSNPRVDVSDVFTEYVMAIAPGANVNRNFAYPLNIVPETGESTIELLPGEHRVFSAQDYQSSWAVGMGNQAGKAITMAPGWYPPGTGGRDADKVGGISTENLYRDENGKPTAYYKDKTGRRHGTAALPVEANDQIRISVQPSASEIGKFVTAGNRAVDFYLRYGAAAADNQIRGGTEQQTLPDFGAIELDYGSQITEILKEYEAGSEIPTFPINNGRRGNDILSSPVSVNHTSKDPRTRQTAGTVMKKPFLVATLHLKSLIQDEFRSKFPAKAWIHNNPTAIYASAGAGDQFEDLAAQQYEFSYQPLQGDWLNGGFPEIYGERSQGYGGPSPGVEYGRVFAPFTSLPRAAPTSLAQFRHAPLNSSGKQPLQAQVLSNSFAHPLLDAEQVVDRTNAYLDHSFLANQALFDSTFFSGAPDSTTYADFLKGKTPLLNPKLRSLVANDDAVDFGKEERPYENAAAYALLDSAFNVNSTSERAWRAFLTAMNQESIPIINSLDQPGLGEIDNSSREPTVSRFLTPIEESLGGNLDAFGGGASRPAWTGHRILTATEIENLAEALVEEVKERGPFQSLAEFINRRAEDSELGKVGALQAAIDRSGLNDEPVSDEGIEIDSSGGGQEGFQFRDAAEGSSLTGTPGYLTQGDLLHALAPTLTARSDTFRIRSYGASTDAQGRILAETWCEAVVQRYPEYVDALNNQPGDHPTRVETADLSEINERFGRRFRLVSFRWIGTRELLAS